MDQIKVLIVDDSALVRQTFKALLESEKDIRVVGTASDPYIAVQKIQKEAPDVITLDIEMPRMDGITFLKKIMSQAPMPVIVISNQTSKGMDVAFKALELGAVTVLSKPNVSTEKGIEESRILLSDAVHSAYNSKIKRLNKKREKEQQMAKAEVIDGEKIGSATNNKVIAIGASTGGTEALKEVLEKLPANMPPILIVQHMPENFTTSFANRLNNTCQLTVKEAEHNDPVLPGHVYIARGNFHMELWRKSNGAMVLRILKGELVNRHRPSVNVLFTSVANSLGKNAIGVIMTGMGDDGATGLKLMHDKGAFTLAQNEETSAVFGMPNKAIQAGGVDEIISLHDISERLLEILADSKS